METEIETPLDVYTSIVNTGYKVDYLRIAITDELSPIPDVFNQLVTRILSVPPHGIPIFNCQMGRGRTTQGLVITSLMKLIVGNRAMHECPDLFIAEDDTESITSSSANLDQPPTDNTNERLYKKGMYSLILQLLAVLQYGVLAKSLVDSIIDGCQHMQNLRTAIYDYKTRLDALEHGTKKYDVTLEMGCNYLVRYFYLIAFADYLLEIWAPKSDEPISFSDWLGQRIEIQNIVKSPTLDL